MEKTVNFSILKEKIIKTNELLGILNEKNKSLDKSQQWIQHLKTKLELSKNEISKLKLRNEALTSNLAVVEKDYNLVSIDHRKLKDEFNKLENESNNTINTLQVNYQLANQELQECKVRLSTLDEFDDEVESFTVRNQASPTKRKTATKKKKSPQKKQANLQPDVAMLKEINDLKAEKDKLISEKTDFQLEAYELKKKLTNLQSDEDIDPLKMKEELVEFKKSIEIKDKELKRLSHQIKKLEKEKESLQADNERLKIENSLSQEEISTLQKTRLQEKEQSDLIELNKLSTLTKTKNEEINKLSNAIKNVEVERDSLRDENEKLKNENCAFQLEISVLQQNCRENSTNLSTSEKHNDNSLRKNVESCIVHEEKIVNAISAPINSLCANNDTPTDDEICAIMKHMIIPDKLSPLHQEALHDARNSPPFEDNTNKSPSPHPDLQQNIQKSSPTTKELFQNNVIRKRNYLKRRRQLAKKGFQKVDLYGTLLALKKAKINFIISSNSFVSHDRYTPSRLLNFHGHKSTKFKKFEKKKPDTTSIELNCSLANCKNTYMVLKGFNDDEDAPLLGFVGVKNESSKSQDCTVVENQKYNSNTPTHLQCHGSLTRRQTTRNNRTITTNDVSDNIQRSNGPVVQIIESDGEDPCNNTIEKKNETNSRQERTQLQNEETTYNCNIEPVEQICDTSDEENHNQVDENPQIPMNTKRKPPDRPEVRRSKRKCNSLVSRLFKRRKTEAKNKLSITKDSVSCLDGPQTEEKLTNAIENSVKLSSNGNSAGIVNCSNNVPVEDFVFKKPIGIPKSPKTTVKRPVRSRNLPVQTSAVNEQCDTNDTKKVQEENEEESFISLESSTSPTSEKSRDKPKSPKKTFKRPVCSTRRSQRLSIVNEEWDKSDGVENCDTGQERSKAENVAFESPKSPTPENQPGVTNKPVLIPLEKVPETVAKMPTSKIEVLFNKLILYSAEEEALNEVVREFSFQKPEYIAQAILERIALDYHESADTKHFPAPLMTDVQRTMLGFMSKLEKTNVIGVFDSYLTLAEQRLLTCNKLQEFGPVTRLYLAICKLHENLTRMRKLCCDVFYFCGDLAIPFLFTVLTSWTEVLPHAAEANDFPLARVVVQIVNTTDCNKPGYNHMPLRDLLIKFYGYPTERWDFNEFFKELFEGYLKNPSRSSDFALLLYCKSRPETWVYEKVDEHLKPLVSMKIQDNFKATLIILIGNLYNRFSSKSEVNYLPKIREWLSGLVQEETPDVVRRCVYVSLNRLKKK